MRDGALTTEEILARLAPPLVEVTGRFQKIATGLLRWKLTQRIAEARPLRKLSDARFAAMVGDEPWDGDSPMSAMGPNLRCAA